MTAEALKELEEFLRASKTNLGIAGPKKEAFIREVLDRVAGPVAQAPAGKKRRGPAPNDGDHIHRMVNTKVAVGPGGAIVGTRAMSEQADQECGYGG